MAQIHVVTSSPLGNLPSETLLEIFMHVDDVCDMLSLSRTCTRLQHLWLLYPKTIAESVMAKKSGYRYSGRFSIKAQMDRVQRIKGTNPPDNPMAETITRQIVHRIFGHTPDESNCMMQTTHRVAQRLCNVSHTLVLYRADQRKIIQFCKDLQQLHGPVEHRVRGNRWRHNNPRPCGLVHMVAFQAHHIARITHAYHIACQCEATIPEYPFSDPSIEADLDVRFAPVNAILDRLSEAEANLVVHLLTMALAAIRGVREQTRPPVVLTQSVWRPLLIVAEYFMFAFRLKAMTNRTGPEALELVSHLTGGGGLRALERMRRTEDAAHKCDLCLGKGWDNVVFSVKGSIPGEEKWT